MKIIVSILFTLLLLFSGFVISHATEPEQNDEAFIQSLESYDDSLIKIITILMASDQILSCNLDMSLLGSSYREFHDLSQEYIEREADHMNKFVEVTDLLVNSEAFREEISAGKTCEELLSIYGDIVRQISQSSKRISEISK